MEFFGVNVIIFIILAIIWWAIGIASMISTEYHRSGEVTIGGVFIALILGLGGVVTLFWLLVYRFMELIIESENGFFNKRLF